jgi:periplasmic copper chaperone A
MRTKALAVATIASLALAAPAGAHVAVAPEEAPAGGFVVENVRVPNEQEKASTTKVEVQLPSGFVEASYQPVPGWNAKLSKGKLAKPVTTEEGVVSEEVRRVTWTGGKIAPGQFQEFPLALEMPDKPGATLTFKAIQFYDNGDVVRWIGAPDAENPAPQVKVTAAGDTQPGAASDSGDDDSNTVAIIALIAGLLGLLAGATALATRRRTRS